MPSGGARNGAGRPQDPNALRTDRRVDRDLVLLPTEGRVAPAPDWPPDRQSPTRHELVMWAAFWRKPQAIVWEQDQSFELVALFIRQYIAGMDRKSSAVNRQAVRLMAADLLLTRAGLKAAGYRIATDEVEEQRQPAPPTRKSSRSRLKVVPSAAAGA